jgi:Rrf2 family protein
MVELAADGSSEERPAKVETIAGAQAIPGHFLERILVDLRAQGLLKSRTGDDGGYWLAREPAAITLAEVVEAVEGPPGTVRGEEPDKVEYRGSAEPLRDVWIALRASVRDVLESVSLADLKSGSV